MAIRQLPGSSIVANSISTTQLQTTIVNTIEQGGGPRVSSLVYPGNDTAGNTVGGQTVYIVGSGFETNNAIYINGNAVPSKSFISASNLSFTTPALAAGIYPVYVINTDSGATAIFVPGYISSAEPTWVTGSSLSEVNSTDAWNISLSATGDAPITYALAGGSSLPSGISLAANGVISGTLSSPPETDTTYNFTAIATDAQNQDASRQFTITATVGEGLPFANNVLLIHADGTNNQNNHAFLDSSNNNYSITRNGNATQGSFSPFSQTGWSAYFDGDGDECWVYTQATGTIAGIWDDVSTNPQSWIISSANRGSTTAANINFVIDIAGADTQLMSALQPMNKWFHLAITRSGSSWYMFMDGVQVATATSSATINAGDGSRGLNLGAYNGANQSHKWGMQGYISNFRINKGTALYTSAFTPANSALTAVSGTTLLTCQSNRFIDNSSNNYGLTRNGNISIQAFSPFAPTAAYSTANVGGSVYLDGSGDYLTASNPSMSGTWTVEFWWYPITVASQQTLISFNNGGLTGINMWCNPSAQLVVDDGSNPQSAFTSKLFTANSWNHVAIVKNGSTTTGYINGVAAGSNSFTPQTVSAISIGRYNGSPFYYASGYFSGVRLVQSAVYTGAFTPPTAPPTNIANTAFLCNFTNAGIFDQTAKNVLETVGDAKVSTAQYKYGTGSIAFDGTGDWLVSPVSQNFDFGTGDFTIECWFRLNSLASNYYVIGGNYNAGASDEWLFQVQNNGSIRFLTSADSTFATPSPAITTNTWYHLAATRSGSTVRLFIDGTSIRSYTNANSLGSASKKVYWGIQANESSWPFNGYIDDIRITKGYARYTSNFTPPTSALKDK